MVVKKIIKVPRVNGLGKKGSGETPNLLLKELENNYEGFSGLDLEEIHIDNNDVEVSEKLIYQNSLSEFENLGSGDGIVFVGGDHSISYPLVNAFSDVYGVDDGFLIVFDAHADCDIATKNPTHEEWLRGVIEKGFKPENVVLIGVRKMWGVEKKFLRAMGVRYFEANRFVGFDSLEGVGDAVTELGMGKKIYISIDIDVLDPGFAPGVSYPEPGGLDFKELNYLLNRIFHLNVKALDIVEIVPEKDKKYDFRTLNAGVNVLKTFIERNKN